MLKHTLVVRTHEAEKLTSRLLHSLLVFEGSAGQRRLLARCSKECAIGRCKQRYSVQHYHNACLVHRHSTATLLPLQDDPND